VRRGEELGKPVSVSEVSEDDTRPIRQEYVGKKRVAKGPVVSVLAGRRALSHLSVEFENI
jgi:hypothetical protein